MISEKNLARLAGFFYLIVIATGLFAEVFVRQALRVSNNALSTAQNIETHETIYRLGLAADLINFVIGLPCVIIIYFLFKKVNKLLMQVALAFVLVQTAVIAANLFNQVAPLLILSKGTYLTSLQPNQLATLSLLFLEIQVQGYSVGLVFFGCYCLVVGYVLYVSKMLPKFLGVLYAISGLGYLVNSFSMLLSKGFANPLFMYLALPIFIGEFSLCMWLMIKGVNTSEKSLQKLPL